MIYKYYAADIVRINEKSSFVIGSSVTKVYFFCSPMYAQICMDKELSKQEGNNAIANFRRIK